jgi:hypothetical protein
VHVKQFGYVLGMAMDKKDGPPSRTRYLSDLLRRSRTAYLSIKEVHAGWSCCSDRIRSLQFNRVAATRDAPALAKKRSMRGWQGARAGVSLKGQQRTCDEEAFPLGGSIK